MYSMELLVKTEKRIGNPNTGIENIKSGSRDGIRHRKKCPANNEKWKTTNDRRNTTTKQRTESLVERKLRNIGSRHHQTGRGERQKIKK